MVLVVQLEISKYGSAVTYKIMIVNVLMLSLCLEFGWKILSWIFRARAAEINRTLSGGGAEPAGSTAESAE